MFRNIYLIVFLSTLVLSIHGLPADVQIRPKEPSRNVVPGVFISVETLKSLQAQQNANNAENNNEPNPVQNNGNRITPNSEQLTPINNLTPISPNQGSYQQQGPGMVNIQDPPLSNQQQGFYNQQKVPLAPNSLQILPNQQDPNNQQQLMNQQQSNQQRYNNPQQQYLQQQMPNQQILPNQQLLPNQQIMPNQQMLPNQQYPINQQQPRLTNQQQYLPNQQPYLVNQQQVLPNVQPNQQQPLYQQPGYSNQQPIYLNQQQIPNQPNLISRNGLVQPSYVQQNQQIPQNQGQPTLFAVNPINNGQILAAKPVTLTPFNQNQGRTLYAVLPVNNGQNTMPTQNIGDNSYLVPYQQVPSNQVYA